MSSQNFKFSHETKQPPKKPAHDKGNQKEGHGIFGKGMNHRSSNRFAQAKFNDSDDDDDEDENDFYDKKKKAANNKSNS